MKTNYIVVLVLLLTACGNGRWGAELDLSMGGVDAQGEALTPGEPLTLSGGAWSLTLDRACLAVELAVITPAAAAAAAEAGEDCFCHGDPPECHGDCSAGAAGGEATGTGLVVEADAVLDLLAGSTPLVTRGVAPGDYTTLSLVLGGEHGAADPPEACSAMAGRTLWIQGTLTNLTTAETWSLTVDLRDEVITEPIAVTPLATATSDNPAALASGLMLELVLDAVDYASVTADATGEVTIGGDNARNADAAHEILHQLTHAGSYTAVGHQEP